MVAVYIDLFVFEVLLECTQRNALVVFLRTVSGINRSSPALNQP